MGSAIKYSWAIRQGDLYEGKSESKGNKGTQSDC